MCSDQPRDLSPNRAVQHNLLDLGTGTDLALHKSSFSKINWLSNIHLEMLSGICILKFECFLVALDLWCPGLGGHGRAVALDPVRPWRPLPPTVVELALQSCLCLSCQPRLATLPWEGFGQQRQLSHKRHINRDLVLEDVDRCWILQKSHFHPLGGDMSN